VTFNFVLVHGAWHGGWAWNDVKRLLEAEDHRVIAPTLSGLAEQTVSGSGEIGLKTHVNDVISIIEEKRLKNVVLVGHSYGGMVITGVVDQMRDRIDQIVYLDAAVPDHGQSMISYGPPISDQELEEKTQLIKMLSSNDRTFDVLPPEAFGIPPSHPRYDWVKTQLRPHPMQTWLDPIMLENGGSNGLRRTYIHCVAPVLTQTNFPYVAAVAKGSADWDYAELRTGHDAMVTAPEDVAQLLLAGA
jgi:pimeloyl-ACP methyl ester carboxylesterase